MSTPVKQQASAYLHHGYADTSPLETVHRYKRRLLSQQAKSANPLHRMIQFGILLALLFGIAQCTRTLLVEAYKLSILSHNQPIVAEYLQKASHENQLLQNRIHHANSPEGLEALARNDLNLVGEDEILVRLH